MSEAVNLAMPFGLPAPEADPAAHYDRLAEESAIEAQPDHTVSIYTASGDAWSSVHAMCRCLATIRPEGSPGPDGAPLDRFALMIKPWFWDFLHMSENSGGGLLPSAIWYRGLDLASVRGAIGEEIARSERYNGMPDRDTLAERFVAGEIKLLLPSETKLGTGAAVTDGAHSGRHGFDLQFCDADGTLLDPSEVNDVFAVVGGRTVAGHPFAERFSSRILPRIGPLEGGTRFKLRGEGLSAETNVSFGVESRRATETRVSEDGTVLYGTFPASSDEGPVDVIINVPGNDTLIFRGAFTYVAPVNRALGGILMSLCLHIAEFTELIVERQNNGSLNDAEKGNFVCRFESMFFNYHLILLVRNSKSNGSLAVPEIDEKFRNTSAAVRALCSRAYSLLRRE